ncbi:MAG TPA: M1 family metallopeptidase, partial [Pseudomonadota bacterium]|nr:M1 family metallopeptidase [Pseudomonadota bacterium]
MKQWMATVAICLCSALRAAPSSDAANPDRVVLPPSVAPLNYELRIVPDLSNMSFTGAVKIDIAIAQPTRQIVLNAADLRFERIALTGSRTPPTVSLDPDRQTATFTFAVPIAAGGHVLEIAYEGKINRNAAGLFVLESQTPAGKKQALFTQFENSDARRFLPCWDEPARKATFTLIATIPDSDMAISNMPIASTEPLPNGLKRVQFARSPQMSSYLLFFGSGDFERVSRKVHDTDVGVVVMRGNAQKAQYALEAASELLPYYENYFGVQYPLPKLDLIAGPGVSQTFEAMENWGAIFFFEHALLIDPNISTQADRRWVYVAMAHEMAHQWFGDLVTMEWWDDVWLNEGFASWMENKATGHFHPVWTLDLDALSSKEYAMTIDARQGTHPVVQPIRDVLQANQAFDSITYLKGEAVIRMLEAYVGEEAFRAGVRRYIVAHAYQNSVTEDLWRELDATSSTNVSQIARDFTQQAGVPLIRIAPKTDGIQLTQERFVADDSGREPTHWHVPVIARWFDNRPNWQGIVGSGEPASAAGSARAGVLVNAGQAGYYRTLYPASALQPLIARFASFSPADELGLLNDSRALGYTGYEPLSDFLEIASQATPDIDPSV